MKYTYRHTIIQSACALVTVFVAMSILQTYVVYSQIKSYEDIRERNISSRGDTIETIRQRGELRYGLVGSSTLHYHTGSFFTLVNPTYAGRGYLNLNAGGIGGGGFSFGGVFDYLPSGEKWWLSTMVHLFDYRSTGSVTAVPGLPSNGTHQLDNSILAAFSTSYISIMPSFVLRDGAHPQLQYMFGADFDLLLSSKGTRRNIYYENERIEVERSINYTPRSYRVGGHIGIGYEIFAGTSNMHRLTMMPFLTLHAGTPIYTGNGSTWNSFFARAGVNITIGKDLASDTTYTLDTLYSEPPQSVLTIRDNTKMNVDLPVQDGMFIATLVPIAGEDIYAPKEVVAVEPPITSTTTETKKTPAVTVTPDAKSTSAKPATSTSPVPSSSIILNKTVTFSTYSSSFDTTLTSQVKNYLDDVATYLKNNPTAEVRIIGHADNFGGLPTETQRVSDERALQVARFLSKRGILRDRILMSGMGARKPIQNNMTPQGRAANRRVEIIVVK